MILLINVIDDVIDDDIIDYFNGCFINYFNGDINDYFNDDKMMINNVNNNEVNVLSVTCSCGRVPYDQIVEAAG